MHHDDHTASATGNRPNNGSLGNTRKRILLGAGLATLIGLTAVGVGSANGSSPTAAAGHRSTEVEVSADERGAPSTDLGQISLQDLADELSELGLSIRIESTDADTGGINLDDSTEDPVDDPADDAESDSGDAVDPFDGLSDEEIEALSDEEFEAMLEGAGWTIDDEGYIVPPGGVADDEPDGDAGPTGEGSGEDDTFGGGEEPESLGSFDVDGDAIDVSSASDEVAAQAKKIWDRYAELVPADQRRMISSFELNPEEAGGAYVYQSPGDPTKWVLGVSLGLGSDLDAVLIHEFGHLLTLSAEQVPPNFDDEADCDTYFTGEGCALTASTINKFVAEFWPQAQRDEIQRLQEAEDYDGLDAFYAAHLDDFVTDYATTNPGEDLAETFAEFVLKGRPTGDTIADQKVQLLWDDPAMVELRSEIRTNL